MRFFTPGDTHLQFPSLLNIIKKNIYKQKKNIYIYTEHHRGT